MSQMQRMVTDEERWQQMAKDIDDMAKIDAVTKLDFGALCVNYQQKLENDPKNNLKFKDWIEKYCKVEFKRVTTAMNYYYNKDQLKKDLDNDDIVAGAAAARMLVRNSFPRMKTLIETEVERHNDAAFNERIAAQAYERRQKQIASKAASVDRKKMNQIIEEQQCNLMNLLVETSLPKDSQQIQTTIEEIAKHLQEGDLNGARKLLENCYECISLIKDAKETAELLQEGVGVYLSMRNSKGVSVETYVQEAKKMNERYEKESNKAASKRASASQSVKSDVKSLAPSEASKENRNDLRSLLKPIPDNVGERIEAEARQMQTIEYNQGMGLMSSTASVRMDVDEEKSDTVEETMNIGVSGMVSNILNYVTGNVGGRTQCSECKKKFYANQVKDGLCVNCQAQRN